MQALHIYLYNIYIGLHL